MVLAAINTAFAQDSFESASAQWRVIADQRRVMSGSCSVATCSLKDYNA